MQKVGNESEKVARDTQEFFGHINNPQTLDEYLAATYSQGSIKLRRYTAIFNTIFPKYTGNILELGAGVGDLSFFCMSLFPENKYFISELSIKQLEQHAPGAANFFNVDSSNAELLAIEAEHIPFPDRHFSAVIIKASVHHFENPNTSFKEIHRVLKEGGVAVFIEDPVCLNIPIYRTIVKKTFCREERKMGINEHIYTLKNYYDFAPSFSKRNHQIDQVLIDEFKTQQSGRTGIKKLFFSFIANNKKFLDSYLIYRFISPVVFIFTK